MLRNYCFHYMGINFTHQVSTRKKTNHILITSGIYSIERHPSYLGFFVFALGIQLTLGNYISGILSLVVMNKFFKDRVNFEENYLEHFFGEEFRKYKQSTFSFADYLI